MSLKNLRSAAYIVVSLRKKIFVTETVKKHTKMIKTEIKKESYTGENKKYDV